MIPSLDTAGAVDVISKSTAAAIPLFSRLSQIFSVRKSKHRSGGRR
jgi:hypothetical protein